LSCPKVQSPPDLNQQQLQQQKNGVARTTSNDDSVLSDDTSRTLIEQQHQQMVSVAIFNLIYSKIILMNLNEFSSDFKLTTTTITIPKANKLYNK
jgi:hypothetical protein